MCKSGDTPVDSMQNIDNGSIAPLQFDNPQTNETTYKEEQPDLVKTAEASETPNHESKRILILVPIYTHSSTPTISTTTSLPC